MDWTSRALQALLLVGATLASTAPAGAQGSTATGPAECLGFAFGRFVPALDLVAAGHHHLPSADSLPHAPQSRDWAARDSTEAGQTIMLYPSWWPVGVEVILPRTSSSDTLRGTAYALVADGRVTSPQAQVLAWPVPCGRTGRASAPPPVAGATQTAADSVSSAKPTSPTAQSWSRARSTRKKAKP